MITSPSIEADINHALGLDATQALAELTARSVREAIKRHPNPRYSSVFALYHGIREDGTTCDTTPTFAEIADLLGCSRERVTNMYYRAAGPIYARLSNDLLAALKKVATAA